MSISLSLLCLLLAPPTKSYLGWRRRRSSCDPQRGGWSDWSHWGTCTCIDNIATKTRGRTCNNPIAVCGGQTCYGSETQTVLCADLAVQGNWNEWSGWDVACSCERDESRRRERTCDNPQPSCGGVGCVGSGVEVDHCKVDGGWSEWGSWGDCSCDHHAGTGMRSRRRYCINPAPWCRGLECQGSGDEVGSCDDECCRSEDGGWDKWSDWTACDCDHLTGTGIQTRTRSCSNPPPSCYGQECDVKQGREEMVCSKNCCVLVDGDWSDLSEWSGCVCDHSTGTGLETKSRQCSNPAPNCGGASCEGSGQEDRKCSDECCARVDGEWTVWGEWGECSCDHGTGQGTQQRVRKCNDPPPECGGSECEGDEVEESTCSDECCVSVDGQWTDWFTGGRCSCDTSTGTGARDRIRTCTQPEPSCYGDSCQGDATISTSCSEQCCKTEHGGWSDWSEWGICECEYKVGTFQRIRSCSEPAPACGGNPCEGEGAEEGHCDDQCQENCDEWNTCEAHCQVNCDNVTHSGRSVVIESSCPSSEILVRDTCRPKYYLGIFVGAIVLVLAGVTVGILVLRRRRIKEVADPIHFDNPTYMEYDGDDGGPLGIPSCSPPDPYTGECCNAGDLPGVQVNPYVNDTMDSGRVENNPYVERENRPRTSHYSELVDDDEPTLREPDTIYTNISHYDTLPRTPYYSEFPDNPLSDNGNDDTPNVGESKVYEDEVKEPTMTEQEIHTDVLVDEEHIYFDPEVDDVI